MFGEWYQDRSDSETEPLVLHRFGPVLCQFHLLLITSRNLVAWVDHMTWQRTREGNGKTRPYAES
jgi:hypothetical protein